MSNKNYFMNGISEMLILSLLEKRDRYVYEIVKLVDDYSDNLMAISQNTVYTAAYKLERYGHISEYSKRVGRKRTRVYYRIEQSGREYLNELLSAYEDTTNGIQKIFDSLQAEEDEVNE